MSDAAPATTYTVAAAAAAFSSVASSSCAFSAPTWWGKTVLFVTFKLYVAPSLDVSIVSIS